MQQQSGHMFPTPNTGTRVSSDNVGERPEDEDGELATEGTTHVLHMTPNTSNVNCASMTLFWFSLFAQSSIVLKMFFFLDFEISITCFLFFERRIRIPSHVKRRFFFFLHVY